MKKVSLIILFLIVFLAGALRFYHLEKAPPGANIDEVAIGYNAYSIAKTGMDEFGQRFPLEFRSYDDYKPPLLIYLTVLPVSLFGLSTFAVRFIPAVAGTLAVVFLYFACRSLTKNQTFSFLSAFLLAISPWSIIFNRAAFESGVQVLFTTIALFLWEKISSQNKTIWFVLLAIVSGLSVYLYQASKIFAPALLILLLGLVVRKNSGLWKKAFLSVILFGILVAPIFVSTVFGSGRARLSGTSIFQNGEIADLNSNRERIDWLNNSPWFAKLFHNKRLAYSGEVVYGYLSHFRPDFFILGRSGSYTNYLPNHGLIYLWEAPLILLGIYFLLYRKDKTLGIISLSILAISPIPASLTYGVPSAIRTASMMPALQIFTAAGICLLLTKVKPVLKGARPLYVLPTVLVVAFFLGYFTHLYFIHDPVENSKNWYYEYAEIAKFTAKESSSFNKVIISTSLGQPHEFLLYYLRYSPKTYLSINGGTVSGGYAETKNHFANYLFRPINWDKDEKLKNTLLIGLPEDFPREVNVIKKFDYLDNKTAAIAVKTP